MRKSFLAAVALAAVLAPAAAHAQAQPAGDIISGKSEKVRFYGFAMDYSLYDATSLNAVNYTNEISMYFLPRWNLGRLWMKSTPFERRGIEFTNGEGIGVRLNFAKAAERVGTK